MCRYFCYIPKDSKLPVSSAAKKSLGRLLQQQFQAIHNYPQNATPCGQKLLLAYSKQVQTVICLPRRNPSEVLGMALPNTKLLSCYMKIIIDIPLKNFKNCIANLLFYLMLVSKLVYGFTECSLLWQCFSQNSQFLYLLTRNIKLYCLMEFFFTTWKAE